MSTQTIHIIGAGLSGATLARLLADHGYSICIYEMNHHLGGNCYDYFNQYGILVQKYGPHIFHTNKKHIYDFVKHFAKFKINQVKVLANINDKLIDLPINFKAVDFFSPHHAMAIKRFIKSNWPQQKSIPINELINCQDKQTQEWANFIFEHVYKNYSAKMWGIPIEKLDLDVLKRVGITPNYQCNYFPNDKYQGIPVNGFSKMIENMLTHKLIKIINHKPTIKLKDNKTYIDRKLITAPIFYCGQVDELLNYRYGQMPFRSLFFKFETKKINSFQPASIINYPSHPTITRIAEYKKINNQTIKGVTTISLEHPGEYDVNSVKFNKPYYPINNQANIAQYQKYVKELSQYPNFHLLGRLAEYKYFDMDDAIENAMSKFKTLVSKISSE